MSNFLIEKVAGFGFIKLQKGYNSALPITTTAKITGGSGQFNGPLNAQMPVISGSGATVTLTAAQSGSMVLFDRAAGIIFTLPAPVVGLWFEFIVVTTVTSNNHKIITDTGTTLLIGPLDVQKGDTTVLNTNGNGSTHISVLMNGTTTGGIQGTSIVLTCVSSTLWEVNGTVIGSGTLATPYSTT